MERRGIIATTMANMNLIYQDVGKVVQIVEQKMENENFEALSNAAVTWETSTSLWNPDLWLYRWFARAYYRPSQPKRVVGFCVHLGAYDDPFVEDAERRPGFFPFVNVSLLRLNQKLEDLRRTDVYECLWSAGWDRDTKDIATGRIIVRNRVSYETVEANAVTYFIDLLKLIHEEAIEQLIVEPMTRMFEGDEDWVEKAGVEAVQLI